MEMLLTSETIYTPHFPTRITQIILTGRPRPYVCVWTKRPQERKSIGSIPRFSAGGALTLLDALRTGYTLTGTYQIRLTRT